MAFDFKKEYQEFYMPKGTPSIVTVPEMNFIAVRGSGDPNDEEGEYKQAIGLLYGIAFTIKMSKKGSYQIDGYFDYVVPPLEGFWWQDGVIGVDYTHKDSFRWISVIRLPDFVTKDDFDWAVKEAAAKYALDITDERMHHEIYLSDARKAAPEKLRTVIRHPIKVKEN